ncbi:RNA-directed DNA polymerase, eukaryota, reverse transcriptase zinc-binding domain protein [Tanacetum coccineum]
MMKKEFEYQKSQTSNDKYQWHRPEARTSQNPLRVAEGGDYAILDWGDMMRSGVTTRIPEKLLGDEGPTSRGIKLNSKFIVAENADKFKFYYGCKALQLTNMCFADDLLVLCNGDVKSVGVIKKTMDQFSSISGLFLNMGKRVPLIAKKLGVKNCKSLTDKVAVKINCWKNKMLTYAGRIQLIATDRGGLGKKSLKAWNEILLIKQLWKIVKDKESSWVKWVNVVKLKGTSIWDIKISHGDRCGWKKLLDLRSNIKNHVFYSVGSGKNVSMWFDRWDIKGPLLDIIQRRVWYEKRYTDNEKVADMIKKGVWIWLAYWYNRFPDLCNINVPHLFEGKSDKVLWLDNQNEKKEFSTRQAWNDLRENVDKVEWHHVVWFPRFQPRQAFIIWLAILERLATQDRIKK